MGQCFSRTMAWLGAGQRIWRERLRVLFPSVFCRAPPQGVAISPDTASAIRATRQGRGVLPAGFIGKRFAPPLDSMSFKDHFSRNSAGYRQFRPAYPPRLFTYLSSISPGVERAWDCATGTGQAAVGLAKYFSEIIATDASKSQIDKAIPAKGITYVVSPSEKTAIRTASIDVITVAQALHWLDVETFFKEARRVLKPGGVLAVWSYNLARVRTDIDEVITHLYGSVLGEYWPAERKMVERGYEDIRFPFTIIRPPAFEMTAWWNLNQFMGYLCTWSAVRKYQRTTGLNPVEELRGCLSRLWGHCQDALEIKWPLTVKICVKNDFPRSAGSHCSFQ